MFLSLLLAFAVVGTTEAQTAHPPDAALQEQPAEGSYQAPTHQQVLKDYILDTVGPYPIMMGSFTAAIHQGTNNPPEWGQGGKALAKRFGSNMGITAVGNTTRFALARWLDQDTSYYRCRCSGFFPRLRHAGLSALIARRRSDGAQVFSIPGLVGPYTATMTATYAWYPSRYGIQDALRMGNYNLLGTVGADIAYEFVPHKVWNALGHLHLNSRRMAQDE